MRNLFLQQIKILIYSNCKNQKHFLEIYPLNFCRGYARKFYAECLQQTMLRNNQNNTQDVITGTMLEDQTYNSSLEIIEIGKSPLGCSDLYEDAIDPFKLSSCPSEVSFVRRSVIQRHSSSDNCNLKDFKQNNTGKCFKWFPIFFDLCSIMEK